MLKENVFKKSKRAGGLQIAKKIQYRINQLQDVNK